MQITTKTNLTIQFDFRKRRPNLTPVLNRSDYAEYWSFTKQFNEQKRKSETKKRATSIRVDNAE